MTKKPFVRQSAIANSLLDLVHTNVCGRLSIPARGGFSYFITFTNDHLRYGYVYLMRYKSEAFGREWNSLSLDSSWNAQLNGVAERRNRTLLDMVRSMMSFTELPRPSGGYALETAAKLLNIAPSKSVPQTPYEIWHGKPASYKYLRVWGSPAYVKRLVGDKLDSRSIFFEKGFPSDNRRDEVLIEESSEEPHHDNTTSFEPTVHTDSVPAIRRSTRESRVPERLVVKGHTQRPGVDFEETYSPVAMAKSIQILLAIAAWYNYQIWQMDVKMAFLNDFVEEEIFVDQPEGFTAVREGLSSPKFSMGEASYILWIYRDRSRRMLGMTQSPYIEKVLKRFKMEHSKRGLLPMRHGVKLSKKQSPKTDEELKRMSNIPYASAVGSIQYVVQCTRPDVASALSVTSRYQACTGDAHWGAVKSILKYLERTKDMFLIYGGGELILEGYSDASFQSDDDDAKSQSGFVFKLNGGVVAWKSSKQDTTADSTTEAEYIAASEAAKEAVWILHPIVGCGT
ncbi:UNVERIFIED_CONTAM: Retrovirus-related Pol polyprotein from transposon TNT 1-94 [Sesamum latifolium]|uniref:Retrovirus-related Pol polyprotein from transposon TNT 1-94 n=1 Tax=Sesamum latifolium TaxID=2727402 RepID=A0AAW2WI40_9LAMI